jgi:hypothetical protein
MQLWSVAHFHPHFWVGATANFSLGCECDHNLSIYVRLQDIPTPDFSTQDFSTPDFSTMNSSTELGLKRLGLK